MNDSFLEDLGLMEQKGGSALREAGRFVTTRQSPKFDLACEFEREIMKKQEKICEPLAMERGEEKSPKEAQHPAGGKRPSDGRLKRSPREGKARGNLNSVSGTKIIDKKGKGIEVKLKPVENVDKLEELKIVQGSKSRGKRLTGSRESSRLSDGSSKENHHPDSSADSEKTEILKERRRVSAESANKKTEINDDNSLPMLNAIKEIISIYTKAEGNKIMKMMQDLYINSQSNMIKQLLLVTEDLKEINPTEGSPKFQTIVRENSQLLENIAFLRSKVDELQKRVEGMEKLKQENLMLKTRIRELEK